MDKIKAAIIGPGNIGRDLMCKVLKSPYLELAMMAGIVQSEGIEHARSLGIPTTIDSVYPILQDDSIKIVFDCTSAAVHIKNAPLLAKANKIAIDLTPAAIGPYVVPCVNLEQNFDTVNFNLVTCGGQATIPIIYAVSRTTRVLYAEIVSAISSKSAGPGTRQNIDEFTQTTAKAICRIGRAEKGKAIIILNPAEPPSIMTNTIYCKVEDPDIKNINESIDDIVVQLKSYVPGYRLRVPPIIDGDKVTVIVEVEGQGDYLPKYSGNLDIINAAALAIANRLAERAIGGKKNV